MPSGSQFVSTSPMIGMRSRCASRTAIASVLRSITNSASGTRCMFLTPPRFARSFSRSAWAAIRSRVGEQLLRPQQVDDVDAATLTVDEPAHLGVPATRLVAEVHPGLQQLLDPDFLSHGSISLDRLVMRFPGREA